MALQGAVTQSDQQKPAQFIWFGDEAGVLRLPLCGCCCVDACGTYWTYKKWPKGQWRMLRLLP